jgi:prepilin-type processing-associated H-X9-DG protein/prepilin-type N-terminal cleavage/methylation domain-containing protein
VNKTAVALSRHQETKGSRRAFTLAELLVVISTLGILAALVLPVLAGSKIDSQLFQCQNNLKGLSRAWIMYSDANSDKLVNLSTYNTAGAVMTSSNTPWRTEIASLSVTLPAGMVAGSAAAQKYLIEMGFKQPTPTVAGPLYPYVPNVDVLHCPADGRASLTASAYGNYAGPYAWDSYSGSAYLNGDAGGFTKRSQVLHPSGRFIWAEAAASGGENFGSWEMASYGRLTDAEGAFYSASFGDSPAAFHGTAANFSFCDGHVEIHSWSDPTTLNYAADTSSGKEAFGSTKTAADHLGNPDAIWCGAHYAGPQNP